MKKKKCSCTEDDLKLLIRELVDLHRNCAGCQYFNQCPEIPVYSCIHIGIKDMVLSRAEAVLGEGK